MGEMSYNKYILDLGGTDLGFASNISHQVPEYCKWCSEKETEEKQDMFVYLGYINIFIDPGLPI